MSEFDKKNYLFMKQKTSTGVLNDSPHSSQVRVNTTVDFHGLQLVESWKTRLETRVRIDRE